MSSTLILRRPHLDDGLAVHRLIQQCPPLDTNSSYCNFLQCGHFGDTSVYAEDNGELVGFISAYRLPEQHNTLFVWQVAVSETARGRGLASDMLKSILDRPTLDDIEFLETTITTDNKASWALFQSLADDFNTKLNSHIWLDQQQHFEGSHESEHLIRIGPFKH